MKQWQNEQEDVVPWVGAWAVGGGGGGDGFIVESHPMMVFKWWCILVFGREDNGQGPDYDMLVILGRGSYQIQIQQWVCGGIVGVAEIMVATTTHAIHINWLFFVFVVCLGLSFKMYLVLSTALSTKYMWKYKVPTKVHLSTFRGTLYQPEISRRKYSNSYVTMYFQGNFVLSTVLSTMYQWKYPQKYHLWETGTLKRYLQERLKQNKLNQSKSINVMT